jgi:HAD superfamily hydrolase (TIGR01509 family)
MSLKAVIWDVDGTMIDSEEIHRRAFNRAFAKHHLNWIWGNRLYADLLRITGGLERIRYYNRRTAEKADHPFPDHLIRQVYASKMAFYTAFLAGGLVKLRPGVGRLLQELTAKDISICIATATSRRNIDALLTTQLADLGINWMAIVAGDDVNKKKPAPDVYKKVLSRTGLGPEQCLALEDSESGVAAAVAAGITTVALQNSYTVNHDLSGAATILSGLENPENPGKETAGAALTAGNLSDWHRRYTIMNQNFK